MIPEVFAISIITLFFGFLFLTYKLLGIVIKSILIRFFIVSLLVVFIIFMSLPNFISDGGRSKVSSVKANAHTLQTMLETYAVDFKGIYPPNIKALEIEAKKNVNPYWKELKNPFNANTNTALDNFNELSKKVDGTVLYVPVINKNYEVVKYFIYGVDKNGKSLKEKGNEIFYLTNS